MKRPYCTGRGSLKPSRWRNSLRSFAWMSMGRNKRTGSPPRRARKNTAVRARKTTRTVWTSRETTNARNLAPELLIQDLGDEAIQRDGIEAHIGREDHAGVNDLALGQLVEGALDLGLGVPVDSLDRQVFAFERHLVLGGVHEREDARDERLIHEVCVLEEIAVGLPGAPGGEHETRRDLDLAADLHRRRRLPLLRPHQHVGKHVIAGDDSGDRLAEDLRLVEQVLEELRVVALAEHEGQPSRGT